MYVCMYVCVCGYICLSINFHMCGQVDYVDGEDYRLFDPQDGSGRLVVTYTFYPDNRFAQMRMATLVPSSGDDNLTQAAKFSTQSDYLLIPSAKQVRLTPLLLSR